LNAPKSESNRVTWSSRNLCLAGLILLFAFSANLLGAAPKILAGCEINYPPFCIVKDDGTADGFSVELIKAAAKAMNYEVDFVTGTWSEMKTSLKKGQVDALPLVGRTPEREADFDFTVPYLTLRGCIVVRSDVEDIKSVKDLKGKEVAVMKADNVEEFLLRNDFGLNIIPYPDFAQALKSLSLGGHDAVIIQKFVARKLILEKGFNNLKIIERPIEGFFQDFCFAVKEGDKKHLAILNEGLSKIVADGTYEYLHAKWFAFMEIPSERAIVVGGDQNFPPFEFLNSSGLPEGFNVDVVNAVASATGLEIRIHLAPWKETLEKLNSSEIDLIQGMLYSPERATNYLFSSPFSVNHCVAVVRKSDKKVPESLEDLQGLRLVVQRNDIMHDYILKHRLDAFASVVDSQQDALIGVVIGKYDCALVARMTAIYWIGKYGWDNLEIGQEPLISPDYCFSSRRDQKALIAKLNEGLKIINESGEFQRIQNRWLGIDADPYRKYAVFFKYAGSLIVILMLLVMAGFIWSWSLKRQVAFKTLALKSSEEQFRSLIEGAPYAILVQHDEKFLYLNQAAAELLGGKSGKELIGQSVFDFLAPEFHEELKQQIHTLNVNRKNVPLRVASIIRKDGRKVSVEVTAVPTFFEGKKGALVFMRDISRQQQLEAQLRQSSKMEAVGHLAGGVAHDYNNMLSVILGYTEMAMSRLEEADPIKADLLEVYSAAERSAQITNHLLAFARKQTIAPQSLNINQTIEVMLNMLRRLIGEDIELVWQPADDLRLVCLDPAQIDQILANLCVNARDAINGVGKIFISTENLHVDRQESSDPVVPGDYVVLQIKDTGCGMTDEIKNKIFEPFFTTKEFGRGTGLGLATVYGIIKQNDGYIFVESEIGAGTTFRILFPAFASNTGDEFFDNNNDFLPDGNGETLLLVEDDQAILNLSRKIL
jgi:two-component system sensor histidine kinase EvgS